MPDDHDIQLERIRERFAVMGAVANWGQVLLSSRSHQGRAALDASRDFLQATERLVSDAGETPDEANAIRVSLLAIAPEESGD